MNARLTFAALSLAALASACASPGANDATPAAGMSPRMSHGGTPMPMAAMDPRMKAMKDMHHQMMAAKSPAERQSMMAEHMKAMQDGMAMMKEKHGSMQGTGSMVQRHQMTTDHMAMMQMMMDMMAQRMPALPAAH